MAPPSFDRQVKVSCPSLPLPYELLFRSMAGKDGLSQLFEYKVELLSTSPNIPMEKVLGHTMTLSLELPLPIKAPPARRFFNGYVSSFHFLRLEGEFAVYSAVLRPQMWLLTRNQDCRIWEDETVLAVVKSVFDKYGFQCDTETFLSADRGDEYKRREYCVQYNETDFTFVSRLLEEEGIHYFFQHLDGKHELILADSLMGHVPTEGYETIPFSLPDRGSDRDVEAMTDWSVHQSIEADHCGVGDFDFTDPRLEKVSAKATSLADRKHPRAGHFERYQYPEPIVKMKGYGATMAETIAKVRAQEIHAQWEVIEGACNARGLVVGAGFGISDHPREEFNKPGFLLSHAEFTLHSGDYRSTADATKALTYSCNFSAINVQNTFRPVRSTPKPSIPGPQTAIVIGPAGVPVHTDKFGRVKVAFPWTRPETKGKSSPSCWVRVSQIWAGQDWGSMHLPHVGHEVIVSFLDGDPDRPIVTGRVYNGKNPPWQKLPDHASRSYISDRVGNRIVMQSNEEEKGISMHTPAHGSHFFMGKIDSLDLPDDRASISESAVASFGGEGLPTQISPSQEGGIAAWTDGDISLTTQGNRTDFSKGDHVHVIEGNECVVVEKDSQKITKGIDWKLHLGIKQGYQIGAKIDATFGFNLGASLLSKTDITIGAHLVYGRTRKMEYQKETKYDLAKRRFAGADQEIKHQIYKIKDPLGVSAADFKAGRMLSAVKKLKNAAWPKPPSTGEVKAETVLTADKVTIRIGENTIVMTNNRGGEITIESKKSINFKTKETLAESRKSYVIKTKKLDLDAKSATISTNLVVKK